MTCNIEFQLSRAQCAQEEFLEKQQAFNRARVDAINYRLTFMAVTNGSYTLYC